MLGLNQKELFNFTAIYFPQKEFLFHRIAFPKTFSKNNAPKNIFYESDMYTIKLEDGTRILNIEHGLSSLESNFVKIRESKVNNSKPLSTSFSGNT